PLPPYTTPFPYTTLFRSQIAPETIVALRSRYELDRPLPVRYVHWVISLAHGDMGFSFAYNTPVAPLLLVRARNTLLLTVTVMLLDRKSTRLNSSHVAISY